MKTLLITAVLALTTGAAFATCTDPAPPRVGWPARYVSGANLGRARLPHACPRAADGRR
jgi:hypothetical protein